MRTATVSSSRHEPLDEYTRWTWSSFDQQGALRSPPVWTDAHGVASPAGGKRNLRARLSRFSLPGQPPPVTRPSWLPPTDDGHSPSTTEAIEAAEETHG